MGRQCIRLSSATAVFLTIAVCTSIASIEIAVNSAATASETGKVVHVSARQYEFIPDHLVLKRGEPVTLVLTSEDRKHGFLSEDLGIDADILPDRPTEITFTPDKPGRYTVHCHHYCGIGHEQMRMTIVVE